MAIRPRLAMPPALAHLEAWAHDAPWSARLLHHTPRQAAVIALAPTAQAPRSTALHWHPDKIGFSTFGGLPTMGTGCSQWLAQVKRLAGSTTRHGIPAHVYQPHWTERLPGRLEALLRCAVLARSSRANRSWRGLAALVTGVALAFMPVGTVAAQESASPGKRERTVAAVAAEHGLTLHDDTRVIDRLRDILGRFSNLTGRLGRIGPVLMRKGEASTLWLFEFQRVERGMPTRNGYRHDLDVTMLGILIEYRESDPPLPVWQQGVGSPPQPPHTPASLARLATIEDLRMGMAERFVLFASEPAAWALKQAVDQSISAEFHPGLLNSSLPIDVQRAIDVVALMSTDRATPERFYRPAGIDVRLPAPRPVGIQPRLDKVREQMEADSAGLRERMGRQREENAARQAAEREQRDAEREARRAEREAGHAKARADREAESERRRAALQERIDAINERARQ